MKRTPLEQILARITADEIQIIKCGAAGERDRWNLTQFGAEADGAGETDLAAEDVEVHERIEIRTERREFDLIQLQAHVGVQRIERSVKVGFECAVRVPAQRNGSEDVGIGTV